MKKLSKYKHLVYQIIGAAMDVHAELRWGLLEAVYQEALHLELLDRGIKNERESEIDIRYKQHVLDKKYKMDIVVDDVIVELKSVTQIIPAHRAQLCNYLRLTRKPVGLLINFGAEDLFGERWAYDEETNECFLVDRDMEPLHNKTYTSLLFSSLSDEEENINDRLMSD